MVTTSVPRPHALAPRKHYAKKDGNWKPKMTFKNEAIVDSFWTLAELHSKKK